MVILGLLGVIVFVLVSGFVDTWWEQHEREKNERG